MDTLDIQNLNSCVETYALHVPVSEVMETYSHDRCNISCVVKWQQNMYLHTRVTMCSLSTQKRTAAIMHYYDDTQRKQQGILPSPVLRPYLILPPGIVLQ